MAEAKVTLINRFPELADALHKAIAEAVANTADGIAATYSATAPRDTGFMAESAYVVTFRDNTYGANGGGGPLAQPVADKPDNDFTAYAGVAAEYSPYVELGTVNMPAQPAFHPAVDRGQQQLEQELSAVADKLKGVAEVKG